MKKIFLGLMLVLCVFGASLFVGCDKSDDVNPGPGPEIINPPSGDDDNSNPSDDNKGDDSGDTDDENDSDNTDDTTDDDTTNKDKEWNGIDVNELCDAIREEVLLNLSLESGTPTINMQDGGFILTLDFSIEAPCLDDSYIELIEECVDLTLSQYSLSYKQTISILDDIVTIIITNA